MECELDRLLRRLIAEAGFTRRGPARRLDDLGTARGLPGPRYDHGSVPRRLTGRRPRGPVLGLLTEIFAPRLGRAVDPENLGLPAVLAPLDLGQEFTHTWHEGISTVTAPRRADVERRRFLLDSTFVIGAGSAGALRRLTLPMGGRPEGKGTRRVGMDDIAAIRRRDTGDAPGWIAYFDEAYLSAKFAYCFRDLGDGPGTVRHARRSLEMDRRYVRGRVFNLSLLSAGLLTSKELEEACSVAAQALELARGLESARTRSYVADLWRRLDPHAAEPPVAELNERVGELSSV